LAPWPIASAQPYPASYRQEHLHIEATKRMQAQLAAQVKPQTPVIVPIIINPGISTVRK